MRTHSALVLLSFLLAAPLAAQTPADRFFPIPPVADGSELRGIAQGADGRLWTGQLGPGRICAVRPDDGQSVCAAVPAVTGGIAAGPDGNVWFGTVGGVGRITPSMQVTLFDTITGTSDIVLGPDGNMWYVTAFRNVVGRITPTGQFTEFPVPVPALQSPDQITSGGGFLWAVHRQSSFLVRIEIDGTMTTGTLPFQSDIQDMTMGHDGNLWFASVFGIRVVSPAGLLLTSYATPATSITRGPGESMWFGSVNAFGRIENGSAQLFQLSPPFGRYIHPGITTSADGAVWMSEYIIAGDHFLQYSSWGLRRIDPSLVTIPIPTLSQTLVVALAAALAAWALFALR